MASEERLIDAGDLWSDIMMLPHNGDMVSSEEVERAIMDAPTVDAAEVVHARWENGHCMNCGVKQDVISIGFSCTGRTVINYRHTRFCHDCGAKMDGERREGE